MTSQLYHYFQASQAVHVADDITTQHFLSILLTFVVPTLTLLFTKVGLSAQPYSINFGKAVELSLAGLNYLSMGSSDLIQIGKKSQLFRISGSRCRTFLWRTLMTTARRKQVRKGRTPMYRAIGPAIESPKM